VALAALTSVVGACGGDPRVDRAGAGDGSTSVETIEVDGRERTYRQHVPPDAGDDAMPLVVVLHGGLGSAEQAEAAYGWNEVADRERFVVAHPDGLHRAWVVSDGCCGPPVTDGVDDVAFIEAMIDEISEELTIDPDRVHVSGMSNGGMMAYRLACDTTRFAAIGPVGATLLGACPDPSPTSVLHIHGTEDVSVPFGGGPGARDNGGEGRSPLDLDGPSAPEVAAMWRDVDGCDEPSVETDGAITVTAATCPDGRAVELIAVDGAGHQWPGAARSRWAERVLGLDPPSDELDATETLWAFFAAQPRPGP
jgi:polyhydroxybutyrate depolymerase